MILKTLPVIKMSTYILFSDAFEQYIKGQKAVSWGFRQQERVMLPNGYYAFPCGYFTRFENGYSLIASGESLGSTPVQEAMILDPQGVPIARDTEDLRDLDQK